MAEPNPPAAAVCAVSIVLLANDEVQFKLEGNANKVSILGMLDLVHAAVLGQVKPDKPLIVTPTLAFPGRTS